MVYLITTLVFVGCGFFINFTFRACKYELLSWVAFSLCVFIFVVNFIITPITHSYEEINNINRHKELTKQYTTCNKEQNINCAAIIKSVLEYNSDLRSYKQLNQYFDLYYSDEVANLELIE